MQRSALCRSRRELSNAYLLAKFGFNTAENEPSKDPRGYAILRGARSAAERHATLEGSFSAVSKPNFASKYAFESSRRDLHNALLCTALKSHLKPRSTTAEKERSRKRRWGRASTTRSASPSSRPRSRRRPVWAKERSP